MKRKNFEFPTAYTVLFLSWAQGDGKKIIKIEEKTHSGQQAYIKL